MRPAIANFTDQDEQLSGVYQGSPFTVDFQYTDDAGVGISIAGFPAIEMRLRSQRGDGAAAVIASVANSRITITTPAIGLFRVSIPQTVIGALTVGVYDYDISLIDGGGLRWALVSGQMQIVRRV